MLKHWPPLNALRGFEAAARLGSFHKAAEELHLSHSTVSHRIRGLERLLEMPLFTRSTLLGDGMESDRQDHGHALIINTMSS